MNAIIRSCVYLCFCSAFLAFGQSSIQPSNADSTWQALQALTLSTTVNGQPTTIAQEITRLQREEQQANSFYSAFPTDSRAKAAKKIEALSRLQEVELGASTIQDSALALATSFVNDTTQNVQDRFDVELVALTTAQAASLQGMTPLSNGSAFEAIADTLYEQFGDVAPAYEYYLNLTMCADNDSAEHIAGKIQTSNAPAWVKAQAGFVINRAELVGAPVQLTLNTVSNQPIDLSQPSGQTTVVYFWGGVGAMSDLGVLNAIKANVPTSVRWIFVALNNPSPPIATVEANTPITGVQCFDPVNLSGWIPQRLFLQITPYAYVFKSNGTLSGYGPPVLIPTLVTAAGQ